MTPVPSAAFEEEFFAAVEGVQSLLALFDHLPNVYLFVKDRRHRFTMVNLALARLHACEDARGMLGKTDRHFHPPTLARQYVEEDRRIMAAGRVLADQVWLVPGADRKPRWYLSTKLPVRDRTGRVMGIAGVMRPFEHAGRAPDDYQRLVPAIDHVLNHYSDSITVDELAQKVRLSVSQLQREFRRLFKLSPSDYLEQVRVQMARQMLEATAESMATIAFETGFYDQSYLVKRFKLATGMRPLEYRLRFRNNNGEGAGWR